MTTVVGFPAAGPTLGSWAAAMTSLATPFLIAARRWLRVWELFERCDRCSGTRCRRDYSEEFVVAQVPAE